MAYSLSQSYFGANLISDFNFINYADPSNGFVRYVFFPLLTDIVLHPVISE